MSDTPTCPLIPSVEAVEYGRKAVSQLIDRYKEFEQRSTADGKTDAAKRFRAVHATLTRELYGFEDGGCVITAFDKRWLDPKFRDAMEQVRSQF